MQSWHFEGKAAEEMFRQEQREQEDREKKRAEKDKPFGLLARMKATGWEAGQQLPVVDGIESDHTIDFTIIPIAKPLEWLVKPLLGLVRAQWLGRVGGKEGTSLLKPLGLGSTGRAEAANLTEQLAMKEIISNPAIGNFVNLKRGMTDPRWPQADGWRKMSWNNAGVEIHYVGQWSNGVLKAVDDFKFK